MKKYGYPILLAILIGFLLGNFMIKRYDLYDGITFASNSTEKIYFFQYGVYSSIESMEKNTSSLTHYIYQEKEDRYYVYIALTKNERNVEKLKGLFQDLKYNIYVKEIHITDDKQIELIEKYDQLLNQVEDNTAIQAIVNQLLEKYKEFMS